MATAAERRPAPAGPPGPVRRMGGLPRLFWVLWAGILINRLGTMVEPFLGLYLVAVRGFSVVVAGAVLAVYALGSTISQILGGFLADAVGRRPTLTLGMLANGVSLIALGYVTATSAVIAMTFGAGLTIDIYRPAAQALVADLIPAADRTRAYGLISWAANLGFSAAMLSGGMLAQAGFRWLFWADALTCAGFAALAWRAMPSTKIRPGAHGQEPGGFGTVLRDRVMAGFMLVVLGQMAVYQQAFTTLPIVMHAAGLPPRAYGLVMAFNGILIVLVQPLAGGWLGRRDPSLVVVAGNVLIGAGFAVTALASSAPTYAGAVCIWTIGEIALATVGGAIVAGLAPAHLRGRYLGLYGASSSLGALLAPLGGTQLLDLGPPVLWLTCGAVAGAAALGQLALAPVIRSRARPAETVCLEPSWLARHLPGTSSKQAGCPMSTLNQHRPHRARDRRPPQPPPLMAPTDPGQIRLKRHEVVDGLISEYNNAAYPAWPQCGRDQAGRAAGSRATGNDLAGDRD